MATPDLPLRTSDLYIRDPFIVADKAAGLYYMYAQSGSHVQSDILGAQVYTSPDLERWSRPTSTSWSCRARTGPCCGLPRSTSGAAKWYLFGTPSPGMASSRSPEAGEHA